MSTCSSLCSPPYCLSSLPGLTAQKAASGQGVTGSEGNSGSLAGLSVLYSPPQPPPPVRAMAAEGSIRAFSPPSMGPVPWMIKLLAVPNLLSLLSGFVLKHQDSQRLP